MAQGLDAIKSALARDFGNIEIQEDYDIDTREHVLRFEADLLPYQVRVTQEYDDDYESGQVNQDLTQLRSFLRGSNSGKIRVFRTGIISK